MSRTSPDAIEPTLRFALRQLDKVNGTATSSEQGLEKLDQLWWDADDLAHDAFHCGVSGVRWRPLEALDGLERASKLQTLFVPESDIDSLEPIANAPVRTVNVAKNRRLGSLVPLTGSPTLCELDISETAIRDLSPLRSASALQKLTARGLDLCEDQLPVLAELRRRGTEILVASNLSRQIDALAFPASDSEGSKGASILREAGQAALAEEWDERGPDSRGASGVPLVQRAFAELDRDRGQRNEVVCGLVEAGADVDAESLASADTLLSLSVGDSELCHRLLDLGADPNRPAVSPALERLLERGAGRDHALIDRLVKAGAHMTPRALSNAAELGDLGVVRRALAQGLDPNADGDHGRPIERAASGGSTDVVAALLDAGADPSLGLPHARSLEVYEQLIEAGGSPTARSVHGANILQQLATLCAGDEGLEDLVAAVVRDGVPVTGEVLSKAMDRDIRTGGLPLFRALAAAGAPLDRPWYVWNERKKIHAPRTIRDQRRHPAIQAFAKQRKIPTGASRIKAMLGPLAEHQGPLTPGDPLWGHVLALADLLPKPESDRPAPDVLPPWVATEADRARGELAEPLRTALAPLAPAHPAVLLSLAEGLGGTTPSGKGLLTVACEVWPGDPKGMFATVLEGLLDAGAPVDVGSPLPLETYLETASSSYVGVSAALVERLMDPRSRTKGAYFWMAVAVQREVDDAERVLASFDHPTGVRSPIQDIALTTYAEIGDLARTERAAEGQHWTTLTHALNQALQADHLPVVDALLERGANPNFHAHGTNPALFWARSAGAVRRLAAAGARLDAVAGRQRPMGAIMRLLAHEPHLIDVLDALLDAGGSLSDTEPMNGQTMEAQLRAMNRADVTAWLDARR